MKQPNARAPICCSKCDAHTLVIFNMQHGAVQDIDIKRRKSMAAISRGLTTPNLPPGVTLQRQSRSVGKVAFVVMLQAVKPQAS